MVYQHWQQRVLFQCSLWAGPRSWRFGPALARNFAWHPAAGLGRSRDTDAPSGTTINPWNPIRVCASSAKRTPRRAPQMHHGCPRHGKCGRGSGRDGAIRRRSCAPSMADRPLLETANGAAYQQESTTTFESPNAMTLIARPTLIGTGGVIRSGSRPIPEFPIPADQGGNLRAS